jgi:hypothetical protein
MSDSGWAMRVIAKTETIATMIQEPPMAVAFLCVLLALLISCVQK